MNPLRSERIASPFSQYGNWLTLNKNVLRKETNANMSIILSFVYTCIYVYEFHTDFELCCLDFLILMSYQCRTQHMILISNT